MAGNFNDRGPRRDRFGNEYKLSRLKSVPKGDYGQGRIEGLHTGYFEIGKDLYKVTVSPVTDEKARDGRHDTGWLTVTKLAKREAGKW